MEAVKIAVIESERGWGRKIDDWMVCLTSHDALLFADEFNSHNVQGSAPDWYMQVEGEPEPITLTDKQFADLNSNLNKREWLSILKRIK